MNWSVCSNARGAAAWALGQQVCWRCGYDISAALQDAACPECGAPISLSREVASLSLSRSRGLVAALCQFAVPIFLIAFFAIPIALDPESERDIHSLHPVFTGPIAAMLFLNTSCLLMVWLTRPPAALGLSVPWRATIISALISVTISVVFFGTIYLRPSLNDELGTALFTLVFASGLATCATAGWSMAGAMCRLRKPTQAARWHRASLMYLTSLLATAVTALLLAVEQGGLSRPGPWIHTAGIGFIAIVAAIIINLALAVSFTARVLPSLDA